MWVFGRLAVTTDNMIRQVTFRLAPPLQDIDTSLRVVLCGLVTSPVFWKHVIDDSSLADEAVNVVLIFSVVLSIKYELSSHVYDGVIEVYYICAEIDHVV